MRETNEVKHKTRRADGTKQTATKRMANYGVITWNEEDLVSSKNAVVMLANRYGVDVVFELEEDGEFGNLDVSSVLEEAGFIAEELESR